MPTPLVVSEVSKSFFMHLRGGLRLPVVENVSFALKTRECAVLGGPSGVGKSSIIKMLYGNYAADTGQIIVQHDGRLIDLASASPRTVLAVRRDTIGYVSQFLRTVPRVSAVDVVAEPLAVRGSGRCRPRRFPEASSSASTSRGVSSPIIRYSCWTSRPPRWTPKTARW